MKPVERSKTNKLIKKIETGNFDENDIDSLFMKLRAYSSEFLVFREIADFVAHNDLRDRGLANQSLETMYLRIKFFLEYNSPKKHLDLSSPFPIWIKRLIKLQVNKCDESSLRTKFNVTKQRLLSRIDNGFKDDKKNQVTTVKIGKLSQETVSAIQHVMSFINGNAAFSQKDMIDELINVLKSNKIDFDELCLRSLSNKITICTLLLFHKSEFDFKGYKPGRCEITCEKESISHNVRFVDADGNEVDNDESFGNLSIRGTITLDKDGRDLSIAHDIMSTELDAENWCSEALFYIEPFNDEIPHHMCKRLKLETDLSLNEQFKLECVND